MRKLLLLIAVLGAYAALAWASVAFSQDPDGPWTLLQKNLANVPPTPGTMEVVPANAEQYEPIVATLETVIPDGAKVFGDGWSCSDGIQTVPVSSTVQHIWATPGDHEIGYKGLWIHTKEIEIVDAAGNKQTITTLLGYGYIDCSASFHVEGPNPNPQPGPEPNPGPKPKPNPNPLPPGQPLCLIISETSARTPIEVEVETAIRRHLESQTSGPTFRLMDPSNPSPWLQPILTEVYSLNVKLPALVACVQRQESSGLSAEVSLVGAVELPARVDDAVAWIEEAFDEKK